MKLKVPLKVQKWISKLDSSTLCRSAEYLRKYMLPRFYILNHSVTLIYFCEQNRFMELAAVIASHFTFVLCL